MNFKFFLVFSSFSTFYADMSSSLKWQGLFVMTLLMVTLFFLIKEYYPSDITLLVAGTIPLMLGILTKEEYVASFANETIITIGMLFLVSRAFEKTGLLTGIVKKLLPGQKSVTRDLSCLLYPVAAVSAFINNTPLVILLTPVLKDWAISNKKSPSKYLMPLSFAAILGGACSLIGTSTNLVVSYFLEGFHPGTGFTFFEIGKVGFFCAVLGVLYLIIFSDRLLPKREASKILRETLPKVSEEDVIEERSFLERSIQPKNTKGPFLPDQNQEKNPFSSRKKLFIFSVIIAMICSAIYGYPLMLCVTSAVVIFLLFKVISPNDIVQKVNWNLLILIAGGLALAKAIEVTNVAHFFAKPLLFFFKDSPHLFILIIFIITCVLTELVTNVAAALIVLPIALSSVDLTSVQAIGNIKAIGITVAIAASYSFLTPIGYQTNAIIYGPGGYKFRDYFRLGFFLTIMIMILVACLVPYFWQMS